MDDLIADFVAECREMLEALSGEIVAWEADPADRARLDSIFRFVHTVKGNCGFFDFPRLEALSHAAEDALADVRGGRRSAAAALAEGKAAASAPRTIRLSVELLDRVMSGVSDMVLARNELARRLRETPSEVAVDGAFERLSAIMSDMR